MVQNFEDRPADRQKITFKTYREFAQKRLRDGSLPDGVYARPKVYSNFALFLADQCPWHFVLRVKGTEKTYVGPLIVQMTECLNDLKESTPFVNRFNRAGRYRRFPEVAVKEALVNAVIHFDASMEKDIIIELSEDILSITSPGGYVQEEHFEGIVDTCPRNIKTARLLMKLGDARLTCTGVNRIKSCYCTSGLIPVMIIGDNEVCVQLPSLDNAVKTTSQGSDAVLEFLRVNNNSSLKNIAKQLMISSSRMEGIVKYLESENKIAIMGLGNQRTAFFIKERIICDDTSDVQEPDIRSSAGIPDHNRYCIR